jgi:hypothetical protein
MNNKRNNFRLLNYSISILNQDKTSSNTSGVRGVHITPYGYKALIQINKKVINLGIYPTLEKAAEARKIAEQNMIKESRAEIV